MGKSYFLLFAARLRFELAAASRRRLPPLKRTAFVAGIFKLSPVRRLRPRRALRDREHPTVRPDLIIASAAALPAAIGII